MRFIIVALALIATASANQYAINAATGECPAQVAARNALVAQNPGLTPEEIKQMVAQNTVVGLMGIDILAHENMNVLQAMGAAEAAQPLDALKAMIQAKVCAERLTCVEDKIEEIMGQAVDYDFIQALPAIQTCMAEAPLDGSYCTGVCLNQEAEPAKKAKVLAVVKYCMAVNPEPVDGTCVSAPQYVQMAAENLLDAGVNVVNTGVAAQMALAAAQASGSPQAQLAAAQAAAAAQYAQAHFDVLEAAFQAAVGNGGAGHRRLEKLGRL